MVKLLSECTIAGRRWEFEEVGLSTCRCWYCSSKAAAVVATLASGTQPRLPVWKAAVAWLT